ncbi:DUF262 domain-containing HNH endonuclease family protein [Mycoplasma sp. AC157]
MKPLISDIFKDLFFLSKDNKKDNKIKEIIIPRFQRKFVWNEREASNFIKKFINFYKEENNNTTENNDLYFGTFVVLRENPQKDKINIIDGQQRFLTTFIFLKSLHDFFLEKEDEIKVNLLKGKWEENKVAIQNKVLKLDIKFENKNSNSFFDKIKKPENTWDRITTLAKESPREYEPFYSIYNYFLKLLREEFKEENKLYNLIEKFHKANQNDEKNFNIVVLIVETKEEAIEWYREQNYIGIKLRDYELIKNIIYSNLPDSQIFEDIFNDSKIDNNVLDRFFYLFVNHLNFANTEHYSDSKADEKFNVYEKFESWWRDNKQDYKTKEKMIIDYYENFKTLRLIWNDENIERKLSTEKTKDIKIELFKLKTLINENKGSLFFCYLILIEICDKDKGDKDKLLNAIKFFNNLISRIQISNLSRNINWKTLFLKFYWEIKNSGDFNSFKSILKDYIEEANKKEIFNIDDEIIKNSLLNHFLYNKQNKIADFLLFYDLSLEDINKNYQIEHIFAQNLSSDNEGLESSEIENIRSNYLHTIGNLTLLNDKTNASLGNLNFKEKKQSYITSDFKLNKYFKEVDIWNQEEIEKRTIFIFEKNFKNKYKYSQLIGGEKVEARSKNIENTEKIQKKVIENDDLPSTHSYTKLKNKISLNDFSKTKYIVFENKTYDLTNKKAKENIEKIYQDIADNYFDLIIQKQESILKLGNFLKNKEQKTNSYQYHLLNKTGLYFHLHASNEIKMMYLFKFAQILNLENKIKFLDELPNNDLEIKESKVILTNKINNNFSIINNLNFKSVENKTIEKDKIKFIYFNNECFDMQKNKFYLVIHKIYNYLFENFINEINNKQKEISLIKNFSFAEKKEGNKYKYSSVPGTNLFISLEGDKERRMKQLFKLLQVLNLDNLLELQIEKDEKFEKIVSKHMFHNKNKQESINKESKDVKTYDNSHELFMINENNFKKINNDQVRDDKVKYIIFKNTKFIFEKHLSILLNKIYKNITENHLELINQKQNEWLNLASLSTDKVKHSQPKRLYAKLIDNFYISYSFDNVTKIKLLYRFCNILNLSSELKIFIKK